MNHGEEGTTMGLVDRAKAILLTPGTEWPVVEQEQTTVSALYQSYIIPLAAIGPVAGFIRASIFGITIPFVNTTVRVSPMRGVASAIVSYALALVGVFVVAKVIDALAPSFGGQKNEMQALKLVTYASTASWLCAIFVAIPGLSVLSLLGLYSIYLFWTGLPVMMKNPRERNLGYCVVAAICVIVVMFVISAVTRAMTGTSVGV
jgi:hypothetical protein